MTRSAMALRGHRALSGQFLVQLWASASGWLASASLSTWTKCAIAALQQQCLQPVLGTLRGRGLFTAIPPMTSPLTSHSTQLSKAGTSMAPAHHTSLVRRHIGGIYGPFTAYRQQLSRKLAVILQGTNRNYKTGP
jgi:hypothetical protein